MTQFRPDPNFPFEDQFSREDWKYEVASDDTNLGYRDWLQHREEDRVEARKYERTP